MKAELYTELDKHNLTKKICRKDELIESLREINEHINLSKDNLIIRICDDQYQLYYPTKGAKKLSVQLNLAMRFRVELDIAHLEKAMAQVDDSVGEYHFEALTDKYCVLRYIDLDDSFMIMDVFVGVKEKSYKTSIEKLTCSS